MCVELFLLKQRTEYEIRLSIVGSEMCLFDQAEDGIRDIVRSRRLGDVYKGLIPACFMTLTGNDSS